MKKIYKIEGMHCVGCANSIERAVKKINGVKSVRVNFAVNRLYA
ncbi:MAG: heavy metal-associated domain-containing protein, partial [Candidatus Pacearchaeota archaeon]